MTNPNRITYDSRPPTTQEWRHASRAAAWRYSAELEELERTAKTNPDIFSTLGAGARLRLGFYLEDRAAAEAAGIDTTSGAAA